MPLPFFISTLNEKTMKSREIANQSLIKKRKMLEKSLKSLTEELSKVNKALENHDLLEDIKKLDDMYNQLYEMQHSPVLEKYKFNMGTEDYFLGMASESISELIKRLKNIS